MIPFHRFDTVMLSQDIPLPEGGAALKGTLGSIVQILNDGKAYLVELFGHWIKFDNQGNVLRTGPYDPEAFMQTIAVETIDSEHLQLAPPEQAHIPMRAQIMTLFQMCQKLYEQQQKFMLQEHK